VRGIRAYGWYVTLARYADKTQVRVRGPWAWGRGDVPLPRRLDGQPEFESGGVCFALELVEQTVRPLRDLDPGKTDESSD
jgi:hypothetical protein